MRFASSNGRGKKSYVIAMVVPAAVTSPVQTAGHLAPALQSPVKAPYG
ncbi:hypothetical protein [Streptomyces sp. NPDC006324]